MLLVDGKVNKKTKRAVVDALAFFGRSALPATTRTLRHSITAMPRLSFLALLPLAHGAELALSNPSFESAGGWSNLATGADEIWVRIA